MVKPIRVRWSVNLIRMYVIQIARLLSLFAQPLPQNEGRKSVARARMDVFAQIGTLVEFAAATEKLMKNVARKF